MISSDRSDKKLNKQLIKYIMNSIGDENYSRIISTYRANL